MGDRMISINEACKLLGVSAQTIYVRRKAGRIVVVKAEKQVRISLAEVERHKLNPLDRSPLLDEPVALPQGAGEAFYDWRLAQLMVQHGIAAWQGEAMHDLISIVTREAEDRAARGVPDHYGRP